MLSSIVKPIEFWVSRGGLTCRKIIYAFAEVILCRSLRRPVKVSKNVVNFTKNHLIQITACILYLMNTVIDLKHSWLLENQFNQIMMI